MFVKFQFTMIIDSVIRDVKREGVATSSKMNISAEVESHIIDVVTKYSYSDPIGSVVRELTSNAIDSHMESGQKDPVIVTLKREEGRWIFSVQDFGLGLNAQEFDRYIMGIGESTKRNNPNLLGGWGSGSACWLSYANSCTYLCRKDGVERKYLIFRGSERPECTMVYEKETTERNGVTFSIQITDYFACLKAIREQLSYLPNVYFNVPDIKNTYKIFDNNLIQWNTLNPTTMMHISLKNIYYPIDWKALGMSPIHCGVALKFPDYSELRPTFNREQIKWDEKAKDVVKKKIQEAALWFNEEYTKTVKDVDLKDIVKNWKLLNCPHAVTIQERLFDLSWTTAFCPRPQIKIKGITLLDSDYLLGRLSEYFTYRFKIFGSRSKTYHGRGTRDRVENWQLPYKEHKIILCDDLPRGIRRRYLEEKFPNVVYVDRVLKEASFLTLRRVLNLSKFKRSDWRKVIDEWKIVEKAILASWEDINSWPIDPTWDKNRLDLLRAGRTVSVSTVSRKGEVSLRKFTNGGCEKGVRMDISVLPIIGINIYAKFDDRHGLYMPNAHLWVVNEKDFDRIEAAAPVNWISLQKYMEGDTQHFQDVCIPWLAYDYVKQTTGPFWTLLRMIYPQVNTDLAEIEAVAARRNQSFYLNYNMREIAEKKKWWDHRITELQKKCMKAYNGIDFAFAEHIHLNTAASYKFAVEVYKTRQLLQSLF